MRRRVTYAFGGHFIASHKSMLYLSYLEISGESFWSTLGLLRVRVNVLAALFDAQAAQILVGVLFLHTNRHINFYAQAAYIRCHMQFPTLRRPLVDSQAAQILVGVIFYVFVSKQTHHVLCTGCVHTRHR